MIKDILNELFMAFMAVGDYAIACLGMHRKSSSKDPSSKPTGTKNDATYLQAKISFMKSHDPNKVSIAK